MRIIISPAKKMNVDTGSFACEALPQFLPKTEQLYERLRSMSYGELKALWKCNDQIAALNFERLKTMDLRRGLTPAILAYEIPIHVARRVYLWGVGLYAGAPADLVRFLRYFASL